MQAPPGFPAVPRQAQAGDIGGKARPSEVVAGEASDAQDDKDVDQARETQGTQSVDPDTDSQPLTNQDQLVSSEAAKDKPRSRPATPPLEQVNRGIRRILRVSADETRHLAPTARTAKGPDGTRGFKYGRGKPLTNPAVSEEGTNSQAGQAAGPPATSALVDRLKEKLAAEVMASAQLRGDLERTRVALEALQKVGGESMKTSKLEEETEQVSSAATKVELRENLVEAKAEIARLQHELFEAKFELNRLRGEAEDRQKDDEVEGKQNGGEEMTASVKLLEEVADAKAEIARLQHELFEANYESQRLKSEMQESIQAEPGQQPRLDFDGELLRREMEGVNVELRESKAELAERDEEIVQLRNDLADFAVSLEQVQGGLAMAEETVGRVSKENVQLREDMQRSQEYLAARGEDWAVNDDLQKKVIEAEAEIQRMRDQLEKARGEIGVRGRHHVGIRKMHSGKLEDEGRTSSRESDTKDAPEAGMSVDVVHNVTEQFDNTRVPLNRGTVSLSETESMEMIARDVAEVGIGEPEMLASRSREFVERERAKELELRVKQAEEVASMLMRDLQEARNAAASYSRKVHELQSLLWNPGQFSAASHGNQWFGPPPPPPPQPPHQPQPPPPQPSGVAETYHQTLAQQSNSHSQSHSHAHAHAHSHAHAHVPHHLQPWMMQDPRVSPPFSVPLNSSVRPPPPQGPGHMAPSAPPFPGQNDRESLSFPSLSNAAYGILASIGVRPDPMPVPSPPRSPQMEGRNLSLAPSAPPYAVGGHPPPSAPPAHLMDGEVSSFSTHATLLSAAHPSAPPLSQMQHPSFPQPFQHDAHRSHPSQVSSFHGPPPSLPPPSNPPRAHPPPSRPPQPPHLQPPLPPTITSTTNRVRHSPVSMGLIPTAVMLSSAMDKAEQKSSNAAAGSHLSTLGSIPAGEDLNGRGEDLGDEGWADEVIVFRGRIG